MQINAREIGRRLEITVGGRDPELTEDEAQRADAEAVRISVPPVSGRDGVRIWALYTRILFQPDNPDAELDAVTMTRIAVGAHADDDAPAEARAAADEQWERINALRWEESETLCQLAVYWNAQGGGMDVVRAFLDATEGDGSADPKAPRHRDAMRLLLIRNNLWTVYSRLAMSIPSQLSDVELETSEPDGSSDTTTPAGISTLDVAAD